MNSKVLLNEYRINKHKGIHIYYGAKDEKEANPISITLKGKFYPTDELKDYKPSIANAKNKIIVSANNLMKMSDWFSSNYILTVDFTECGIKYGGSNRWKIQIYVSPKEKNNIKYFEPKIEDLCNSVIMLMRQPMNYNGFEIKE